MQDTAELYGAILGVGLPWKVQRVEVRATKQEVEVFVVHVGTAVKCPECQGIGTRYDHRSRTWRHLDTCQFRTLLTAEIPRVSCSEHGVRQVSVPWAESGGRFTALFEMLAIAWLSEASIKAVSQRLGISWDEVDGIMSRAVKRGLSRRKIESVTDIGIDETSFQKRHEYVTVVSDTEKGRVLDVTDDRTEESLRGVLGSFSPEQRGQIRSVAMDMWKPYIKVTRELVPDADSKIAFDRFHVAKHINDAVNQVRKQEHKALRTNDDNRLLRTKYLWLMGSEKRALLSPERKAQFANLRSMNLKVGRAWAIKETARGLWNYRFRGWAMRAWKQWLGWAQRSGLQPMRKAAQTVKQHLWGIINAIVLGATNAAAEGLNAKIQRIKNTAHGFRNRARFRAAILFHCGGLDLAPRLGSHTNP